MRQIADPFSSEVVADPYPYYEALRRGAPVHWIERLGGWAVSRYSDVVFVLNNPRLFSSSILEDADAVLIGADPPAHTRNRKIVNRSFTHRQIAALEPRIREIADRLVDQMAPRGECDLVADFSAPLPIMIIAEMLGIEPERHDDYKRWTTAVVSSATGRPDARRRREIEQSVAEFRIFFEGMIAERQRNPGVDLISTLVRATEPKEALGAEEVLSVSMLLLIGGNETTTNLIGNAVLALLRHPELLTAVRRDLSLVPHVVEETLRYDSPVQLILRRATEDVELSGTRIAAGATVVLLLASANRDHHRFPDPARFDPARNPHGHVAFGLGPHFCLGASLARLEAKVALEVLLSRLRRLRQKDEHVALLNSMHHRGPLHLSLVFEPASVTF